MARKNYTDEQKAEILKKAEETSIQEASREYGVAWKTIRGWKASADAAAAGTEAKKKTRTAGRKVKDAVTAVADKVNDQKLADQMAVGRVKATRTRKTAEKKTVKAEKAAVKAEDKSEKAARKPAAKRKARKMNIVFQSVSGGAVTPEQVALKVPKDAADVYVKLEENKIYWVGKNGDTGSVNIW